MVSIGDLTIDGAGHPVFSHRLDKLFVRAPAIVRASSIRHLKDSNACVAVGVVEAL
jgi:hypothetical protein